MKWPRLRRPQPRAAWTVQPGNWSAAWAGAEEFARQEMHRLLTMLGATSDEAAEWWRILTDTTRGGSPAGGGTAGQVLVQTVLKASGMNHATAMGWWKQGITSGFTIHDLTAAGFTLTTYTAFTRWVQKTEDLRDEDLAEFARLLGPDWTETGLTPAQAEKYTHAGVPASEAPAWEARRLAGEPVDEALTTLRALRT